MPPHDAFGQSLSQRLDEIALRKVTEGRRQTHRTISRGSNGMTTGTMLLGDRLTAFARGGLSHGRPGVSARTPNNATKINSIDIGRMCTAVV